MSILTPGLVAYSLQLLALVTATWTSLRLLAWHAPALRERVWQGVLVLVVALPFTALVSGPAATSNTPAADASIAWVVQYFGNGRSGSALAAPSWTMWLPLLLGVGIAARATWIVRGGLRLRDRLRRAASASLAPFDELCRRLRVHARLVTDPSASQPFTFGISPPTVVVPSSLTDGPDATLRPVLMHELLHVWRHDWWWVAAEECLCTLLWFHPAIWLAVRELRQAREEVIDRDVVRLLGSRRAYLDALLAFADPMAAPDNAYALPFFRSRHLARRIAALASEARMSRIRLVISSAAVLTTSVVTLGAAARAFPMPLAGTADLLQAAPSGPAQPVVPGPLEQNAHSVSADAPPPARTRYVAPVLSKAVLSAEPQFTVHLVIDESGRVAESRIASMKYDAADKASANAAAEAVVAAARQWQFERPARAPLAMTVILKAVTDKAGDAVIELPIGVEIQHAEYPEAARAKKLEGDVAVEATIDAMGHVANAKIVRSASAELDQAAIDAVHASLFRPGMRNGEPVPVTITMTMRFKLQ
jgi:TonB family protein